MDGQEDTRARSQPGDTRVPTARAAIDAEPSVALKPSEVLERAAALIEPAGRWIKRDYARYSRRGRLSVDPTDPRAGCFCLRGAVWCVEGCPDGATRRFLDRYFHTISGGFSPVAFNDDAGRTQAEVVTALREAADLARSEGQ